MAETWTMTVATGGPERQGVHPTSARRLVALLLTLATPAWAGPVRCTTSEARTLRRWQILCDDGTRAVTTWSSTRGGWQTTITESPQPSRTCRPHTTGHQLEVHGQ
jgi:hypothetical protein